MTLASLLKFDDIVVQCHDNPDADTIASGYALYQYFKNNSKNVRLIYSGRFQITKPNLLEMVESLSIPLEFVDALEDKGLLITVDCQYGAGNVQKFPARHIAIIDHHQQEIFGIAQTEIKAYLGSCATLVWELLKQENFDFGLYDNVSTALYYGLFTDTNNLAEIYHPLDKDMRDGLQYNRQLIRKLQNSNLTLSEIDIAAAALQKYQHDSDQNFAVFKAQPCDPNILGFISDIALQVNTIDMCVVFNELGDGIKFSVRSCIREVMANELAVFLAEGIGSGGGHAEKAGGYISLEKFSRQYGKTAIDEYFRSRMQHYCKSFDLVYSSNHHLDFNAMPIYKKAKITLGFVRSTDVFPQGSPLLLRTLEGDVETLSSEDVYIMIGIQGEVYPIRREKFERSYQEVDKPFDIQVQYAPTVRNRVSGEVLGLTNHMKACVSTGEVYIYAKPLTKDTKVFISWGYGKYMSGKIGDYIAVRQDDMTDVYIIGKDIFTKTYVPIAK